MAWKVVPDHPIARLKNNPPGSERLAVVKDELDPNGTNSGNGSPVGVGAAVTVDEQQASPLLNVVARSAEYPTVLCQQ